MEFVLDPGAVRPRGERRGAVPARAARARGRGVAVPRGQIVLWHLGIALWVIGFFSPLHALGDELLSAHMAQHLLIADLAAPLLLAGVRNPVLGFLLPRAALVTLARTGWLRGGFDGGCGSRWWPSRSTCSSSTAGTSPCSSRPR